MRKRFAVIFVSALVASAFAGNDAFLKEKTLELLDTYCPDGSRIVRMCMPFYPTISENEFMTMIDGSDERACLTSLNTVVHEENHCANTFIGREVLKEKFGKFSDVFYDYDYFYLKDGRFSLMHKTPTFPSIEMVPEFPEHLRTFRFDTYINTQNEFQSTQNEGIYGLLDEMNSYYQGTKAAYDLLGYYEKKGKAANWHDYFSGVNSSHYGCLEFRFYIFKYLMFAEKHHPDVYRGILGNKTWCGTFLEVDKNVSDLLQSYSDSKPAIFKRLRGYGWSVSEDDNTITINSSRHINFMGVIQLLSEEMENPEYLTMLRTIKEHAEGWNPDSVYSEVALAMEETKDTDTQGGTVDVTAPRPANRRPLEDVVNLSDPERDVEHPFVDLVGASVSKDGDGLVVRMKLAEFPDQLTFFQPDVPENDEEYRWAVMFDADGDGTDDFSIELTSFKPPESEPVEGDPLETAQLTVWELDDQGGQASDVIFRGGRIGNELIFDIPMCGLVSTIGSQTQVRFETYYTDGRMQDQDRMPE